MLSMWYDRPPALAKRTVLPQQVVAAQFEVILVTRIWGKTRGKPMDFHGQGIRSNSKYSIASLVDIPIAKKRIQLLASIQHIDHEKIGQLLFY